MQTEFMPQDHTGDNIVEALKGVYKSWNLPDKYVLPQITALILSVLLVRWNGKACRASVTVCT